MNIEVGVEEGCICWQLSQMCHLDIFGLSRAYHETHFMLTNLGKQYN